MLDPSLVDCASLNYFLLGSDVFIRFSTGIGSSLEMAVLPLLMKFLFHSVCFCKILNTYLKFILNIIEESLF